ncbi:tyrosine-type recombinase/integrase [Cupriavidus taiwanensis]|uniref:Integrase family protein n=1 Tax=Cupriavidus taiwanensis TaxID=164546 RepID=A0A7Z7NR39_9BURK|nr:tyrosine-type recombinase/integrase [Cupriavidus taiwanensis]SOZ17398.1 Integrase family protein [Cupriavidus taiwanensis]SOZ96333.1 Integrase family protein [Cupriavidus taiwanensis]SPC25714.1 Integrase family protein [Cupriavidus taiwanensis]
MSDSLALRPTLTTPSDAFAMLRRRTLPQHLDGSTGTNRNSGRQQIAADRDWDAIELWLSQYKGRKSASTFLAYEKEVSRFYVWVLLTLQKPLSSVVHEDWLRYTDFLRDPQPAALWVGAAKRPRLGPDGRVSDAYKPFAGPLQPKSIAVAERAIWRMFSWLRDAGYLAGNPLLTLSRPTGPVGKARRTERMLEDDQWLCLLNWLADAKRDSVNERRQYARNRWLIALFYSTGIRSSEALTATMGDIEMVKDLRTQKSRAFLHVMGKGSKPREIPLTDEVLHELSLYRQSFGLPGSIAPREETPLIFSIHVKEKFRPLTRQALYTVFKGMFEAAAETLEDKAAADHLKAASTHWMRHMAASAMLRNGTPVLVVRDVLGHADLSTTSLYSHSQALDMHREVEAHNHLDLHQASKE